MLISSPQTWGLTISATVLQNELKKKLPHQFLSQFGQGQEIAYAAIPKIATLEEPMRTEVRLAFSKSIGTVWTVMMGISLLGILTIFLLREVPMNMFTDEKFGLIDGERIPAASLGTASEDSTLANKV